MKMSDDRKLKERDKIRVALIGYDFTAFVLCFLLTYVMKIDSPRVETVGAIIQGLIAFGFLLAFRFVFRVYKQILRYGNMRALARFEAAEVCGGAAFILVNYILGRAFHLYPASFSSALSLLGADFMLCTALRVAYYYIYCLANKDSRRGSLLCRMLILFTGVDVHNEEIGAVVSIRHAFDTEPINKAVENRRHIEYICRQFDIYGKVTQVTPITKGYINRTYYIQTLSDAGHVHKYTLQRINTNVFPDVDKLMKNFVLTTSHLHEKFLLPGHSAKGSIQTVKSTKDGKPYFRDDSGSWRMLVYFDDVYGMDIPDSKETFYYAGYSFGLFMKCMSDVPVSEVEEVIPNFHNTRSRYMDLEKAIAQDPVGRVAEVQPEIEFVRAHKDMFGLIADALEEGRIPTRVCHNDCNLNNILFDNETHLPVAVIDLDTVMPSSPLYDYGDSMRIGTNTAKDDEKDLSKVSCNLELYEQYARGYLRACGDMLTREELELLPWASLIITSEDGIRFLMDHINGDTYYNIFYEGQNLDRCRTQLKLVEDMESKLDKIKEILRSIYSEMGLVAEI